MDKEAEELKWRACVVADLKMLDKRIMHLEVAFMVASIMCFSFAMVLVFS